MKADKLLVPRWVFNQWRYRITPAGKILLGGIIFSGLGLVTVIVPIYQICFGLMALYIVAWVLGRLLAPRVSVSGNFPESCSAGQTVTGHFTITNLSRWPIYDLMLGFVDLPKSLVPLSADQVIPYVPPHGKVEFPFLLETRVRGEYPLPDLRPHTTFPFNLMRSGNCRHPVGSLLVLPTFHALSGIQVPLGNRHQPGGIALTSDVGESPEYIGNREYVPGEPAKRLDFRAWARLGKPVVREYQQEYYCRIALILDTHLKAERKLGGLLVRKPEGNGWTVPMKFGDDGLLLLGQDAIPHAQPRLEAAISLAASVADALSNGEYIIDLFAAGPELYVFRSGRHVAHFENVLEILAAVDACQTDPFEKITPAVADELDTISTAICIFLDWDEPRQQLARTILEHGCSLKVLIVNDHDTHPPRDNGDVLDFAEFSVQQIQRGELEFL